MYFVHLRPLVVTAPGDRQSSPAPTPVLYVSFFTGTYLDNFPGLLKGLFLYGQNLIKTQDNVSVVYIKSFRDWGLHIQENSVVPTIKKYRDS